jgi:uncharacterized protein (TIGR03067 family)
MAIAHSKLDARTLQVAVYAVDENGERADEPQGTAEFKRSAGTRKERTKKSVLGFLEGTWGGNEIGGRGGAWTFVFSGDKVTATGPEPESYEGRVRIHAETDPKQADFVIEKCTIPDFVGKTSCSIYKIEGDVLTIAACMPGSPRRPSSFERRDGARLFVCKRK